MTSILPPVPPERMTPRARAYLWILVTRHMLLAIACVFAPRSFTSPGYNAIKGVLPFSPETAIMVWGLLFFGTATLGVYAAVRGREGEARWALLASVLSSALWAGGFTAYVVGFYRHTGQLVNLSGPVVWCAITLKDITMLRSPLRNPFEALTRRAISDARCEPKTLR